MSELEVTLTPAGVHSRHARSLSKSPVGRSLRWLARCSAPLVDGSHRFRRIAAEERARRQFASCGDGVSHDPLSSTITYEQINIGSNVYIGPHAYFFGPITIGNDVMFGPTVQIQAGYHRFDRIGELICNSGGDERVPVVIGDDVWVAAGASIMKGVHVGEGSVVGTRALVLKSLPPYVVAHGIPAHVVRRRFSDSELEEHLRRRGRSSEAIESIIAERNRALGSSHI